jgi:uncharacterized protein (DUF433 family)
MMKRHALPARFRTESGSMYEIDLVEGVWRRERNLESPFVRTSDGVALRVEPWPVRVGSEVRIFGPPLEAGDCRIVQTTRVVEIFDDEPLATIDADVLGGVPVFHGTRVPIRGLFENLADGATIGEYCEAYPSVPRSRALEALRRAADLVERTAESQER